MAVMAGMAGIDMSMVPFDYSFYDHLVDLVKTGGPAGLIFPHSDGNRTNVLFIDEI